MRTGRSWLGSVGMEAVGVGVVRGGVVAVADGGRPWGWCWRWGSGGE